MKHPAVQDAVADGKASSKLTPSILDDGDYVIGNVYVPSSLKPFCDNPPLLPTEDAEAYSYFIVRLARQLDGNDIIGRFMIQEAVDGMFAVQRVRKIQAKWIALQAERMGAGAGEKVRAGDAFLEKIDAWQKANSQEGSVEIKAGPAEEQGVGEEREAGRKLLSDEQAALALMATIASHERLDDMLERLCARRDAAIQRLERHLAAHRRR
jgi:hypothetical protein